MEFRSGMRLREGASLRVMGDALYDNCLGGLKIGPGMQVVGNVHTPRVKKEIEYRDGVRGDISMLGWCFRYFFSLCYGFRVAPAVYLDLLCILWCMQVIKFRSYGLPPLPFHKLH